MKKIDISEAGRIVKEAEEQRLRDCQREIEMILAKYHCQLEAVARLTPDGRITAIIQLLPRRGNDGTSTEGD